MIVLACGDRHWSDRGLIESTLEYLRTHRSESLTIVEGGCPTGADRMAGQWAARMRPQGVGWLRISAKWDVHDSGGLVPCRCSPSRPRCPVAGPRRNAVMGEYLLQGRELGQTVGVVAFHDDLEASKGTKDMVNRAIAARVPCKLVTHPPGALRGLSGGLGFIG